MVIFTTTETNEYQNVFKETTQETPLFDGHPKKLVGGFKDFFIFHTIWIIFPIDFYIFQDGYCTTNQKTLVP